MDMEKIYLTMKRTGAETSLLGILSICLDLHLESADHHNCESVKERSI